MAAFSRQRFRDICLGKRPGDFGILGNGIHMFWPETLAAWVTQGAPAAFVDTTIVGNGLPAAVNEYFRFDESRLLFEIHSGMDAGTVVREDFHGTTVQDHSFLIAPPYEPLVVEEDEHCLVMLSSAGIKQKVLKGKPFNMPMWLEHPVKDRLSWDELRKRLDPATPERYPSDWHTFVREMNALDCPIALEVGGFFGYLNMWVGTEALMYLFYDDPALVADMMDTVLDLEIEMVRRVTREIRVDVAWYWEDMAYKSGPMISPDMVRTFMLPRYQRLNDVIRQAGCDFIYLDCDGNIEQLIPIWLEAGINFFWPLECAAGMDPVALRKKYGKDIILGGGLDKREFLRDKAAVKEEIMKKVPFLVETGGYFPGPDHLVPMDMPFENFCYYIDLLRQIRGDC